MKTRASFVLVLSLVGATTLLAAVSAQEPIVVPEKAKFVHFPKMSPPPKMQTPGERLWNQALGLGLAAVIFAAIGAAFRWRRARPL